MTDFPTQASDVNEIQKLLPTSTSTINTVITEKIEQVPNFLQSATVESGLPTGLMGNFEILSGATQDLVAKMIRKFLTDQEQFDQSYLKNDHFQKQENDKIIPYFADLIIKKYQETKKPISILDFGCGHGIPTYQLLQRLLENHVQIEKVVGYDISQENLTFAKINNPSPQHITFAIKNLETEFDQVEQYDVVIALFVLHWMNDVELAAKNIAKSLKPGGLLLSLTALQNRELFTMREAYIKNSNWNNQFNFQKFELHPFHDNQSYYNQELSKYFNTSRSEVEATFYNYSYAKINSFFQSWFQEVRHVIQDQKSPFKKQLLSKAYVSEFLDTIPNDFQGKYLKRNNNEFSYAHPLHIFLGTKRD